MKYRTLGRTGAQISAVSLGGAYLAGDNPESAVDNARAVVQCAFELGINYIDTAPLYGNSEKLLGHALEGQTQPFYLSTKWDLIHRISIIAAMPCYGAWSAASSGSACPNSLAPRSMRSTSQAGNASPSRGVPWRGCARRRNRACAT